MVKKWDNLIISLGFLIQLYIAYLWEKGGYIK